MTNDKRACIAFICGMKVNPYRNKQMVFDYSKGEYFHFLVMHRSISGIHVFDYQRNGHVKGAFDMLFDYVANYRRDDLEPHAPSCIIKLSNSGEVKIIRK